MSEENKPQLPSTTETRSAPSWSNVQAYTLAAFCLVLGVALGYLFRGSASVPQTSGAAQTTNASSEGNQAQAALQQSVAPLLDAVNRNPADYDALVKLGDLYYDGQQFSDAIQYYQRALAIHPESPDVRTDMGTAYWYSGNADRALAERAPERSHAFRASGCMATSSWRTSPSGRMTASDSSTGR